MIENHGKSKMIIGIGNDIIEISRIRETVKRFPDQFIRRVFTAGEQATAAASADPAASYAKRFAAKEALVKAIGTGVVSGISWQDIDIGNRKGGRPVITVSGGVKKRLQQLVPKGMEAQIDVSLADSQDLAQAMVIISANPKND